MNLSTHFTLDEFTNSDKAIRLGIDNTPSDQVLDALYTTAAGFERVRDVLGGHRIFLSSGYRCLKLNTAIGGAPSSQHTQGEAGDFTCPDFGTPYEICKEIEANADYVGFDQLIMEGTWVHISFSDRQRGEVLTATFKGGKVTYTKGLA